MTLGRALALWLASFVLAATMLWYAHVPFLALLAGGLLTFLITVLRFRGRKPSGPR